MLLNLSYKGKRNYLHGTDIFNALDLHFRSRGGFVSSLSFRSFAQKQLEVRLEKPKLSVDLLSAEGFVKYPAGDIKFWLVESDQVVDKRYPFNEEVITKDSFLDSDSISLSSSNPFTLIENLVALTKYFSNTNFGLDTGKWIFGKITLNQALPCKWKSILISNTAVLDSRFGRYSVCVDDFCVGEVLFIVSPS